MKKLLKSYVLWTYVMFYCFLLVIGMTMMVLKSPVLTEVLKAVSAWTATFVFIIMFRKIYPKGNLVQFIKGQFSERLKLSTVLCAIVLQLSIFLVTILFTSTMHNEPIKAQFTTSWVTLLLIFGNNLIRGSLGEELGWRGFMQNELQKKFSPLRSAIMIGAAWGFWHAPLWLMSGYIGIQLIQYIVCFMVAIISTSIIMAAFYNWNRNLIIPIIIHQLFNWLLVIQRGELLYNMTVTAALYSVAAAALILVNHRKWLYGRKEEEIEAAA